MIDRRRQRSINDLAKYFLQRAIICKIDFDRKRYEKQNEFIQRSIEKLEEKIQNLNEKFVHLEQLKNLIELPLENYFEQRMERLRLSAEKHMTEFDEEVQHEIEHWKNIHSVLSQPWIEPGLLRSDFAALPRTIQRCPSQRIETIEEENEINRTTRTLTMINRFSILSNGDNRRKRLNKTFIKRSLSHHQIDSMMNDENAIERKIIDLD